MNETDDPTASCAMRLTVDDLVLLDREWSKSDRFHSTELIDGVIYHTPARYGPRARATMELFCRLREALEALGNGYQVMTRASIALSPFDLPLPDVLVVREETSDDFIPGHVVALIVEIAESNLPFFLEAKQHLYARCGIPEYWVVDLTENRVLMHANPRGDGSGYDGQLDVLFGTPLYAATVEGLSVDSGGLE